MKSRFTLLTWKKNLSFSIKPRFLTTLILTFLLVFSSNAFSQTDVPCLTNDLFASETLNGTDEVLTLTDCNLLIEYNEVLNAFDGDEYIFTAVDNNNSEASHITIRSGSFDGPVLGSGFSPVTVTSDIDGALYAHYTLNEFCEESDINCITTTVQCISCNYDCPIIAANIGDTCDDGIAETVNDVVTADCLCLGTSSFDCPLLSADIGDACDDENPDTVNDTVTIDCNCVGTNIFDCPLLSANIGDSCDDGNPETENDVVSVECNCAGIIPVPANDLCENAETLVVYEPGECPENQTTGTTLGASDETGAFSCDPGDYVWPDVFYTFNSGSYSNIQMYVLLNSQTDMVIELTDGCGGPSEFCWIGEYNNIIDVSPNTEYTLRIGANDNFGEVGTFSVCLSGASDCPLLDANIGDSCDDGNANTINDVVNADCNCEGEEPESGSLSGTADWNISCGTTGLAMEFYEPGTTSLIYSYLTTMDEFGAYDLGGGILVGNYDIYAKIDGHLSKSYLNETISVDANTLSLGSFIAGDLNNDNGINISDISILVVSFGSSDGDENFNFLADMNCDGNVNIVDFSIAAIGFGMTGETPED